MKMHAMLCLLTAVMATAAVATESVRKLPHQEYT